MPKVSVDDWLQEFAQQGVDLIESLVFASALNSIPMLICTMPFVKHSYSSYNWFLNKYKTIKKYSYIIRLRESYNLEVVNRLSSYLPSGLFVDLSKELENDNLHFYDEVHLTEYGASRVSDIFMRHNLVDILNENKTSLDVDSRLINE